MSVATVDQNLAWEARHRLKAVLAALLGGLLTLGGGVFNGIALHDTPTPSFLDALRNVEKSGPIGSQTSIRIEQFQFYDAHGTAILVGAFILGLGALAAAGALTYLAYATRARSERFPRAGLYVAFVGGVLVLVGSVLTALGTSSLVDSLLGGAKTVDAVRNFDRPSSLYAGRIIQGVGSLTLAAAYLIVALNAMRVGLLTRFMGVLGMIAGALVILPLIAVAPVLQPFWLLALAVLFSRRWPGGLPPAWRTGKAEPWPTAVELRQQREAARAGRPAGRVSDAPAPAEQDVAARPHPVSKKRKRKRRS